MRTFALLCLVIQLLLVAPLALASRVAEVEDYFHSRTNAYLQSRFPNKPFSIIVSIDTGREEPTRKEFRLLKDSGVDLPLWFEADEENVNIWDRPDVSLGRLIKETKKVRIDIKVDATLSDEELTELQSALANQLKLDPGSDSIVVKKMTWANQERYRNLQWVGGTFAVIMACLFLAFWALTRIHVSRLIRGLSQPIKEIGQTTKKFASNALSMGQPQQPSSAVEAKEADSESLTSSDLADGSTMMELRKSCLDLMEKNKEMFIHPDPYMMAFIEKEGERWPGAMGSILAEMDENILKELYRHGVGQWWFKAIAQPTPLNGHSLGILARLERLRMRQHFSHETDEESISEKMRNLGLCLCRMNCEEIAKALEGLPIEKVGYILSKLPTNLELGTAKLLFPGQWAVFLDEDSQFEVPENKVLDFVMEKAKGLKPPRNEGDIKNFFNDLDLADYLDTADPRDEKDLYRALHEGSRIRQERTPFYEVLESQESFLPLLGSQMTVDGWVHALTNVQLSDREFFLKQLPEKLTYQINNRYKETDPGSVSDSQIRSARRLLTQLYNELYVQKQRELLAQSMVDEPNSEENVIGLNKETTENQDNEDETAA